MRILLDTHILLWMIGNSRSLSTSALQVLSDETNELFFSAVSIAEVSIKHQKNPALMSISPNDVIFAAEECGIKELAFDSRHAAALSALAPYHSDPFDRMLLAQANSEGIKIMSHDRQFPQYGDFVIHV